MIFKSVAQQWCALSQDFDTDYPVSHESLLLFPRQTKKNGALVFCCTDISMPHNYLNVRYDTQIFKKD